MYKLAKRHEIISLIILFLLAFIIRIMTYNAIFVGNNIRFLEFDTFYHMRRVVSFAENFPHIWNFDTYINFPYGNVVGWPPLYDWTIALIANILGFGHPSKHLIEIVGVYFPVFLGSISVIVIYFVTKEIFKNNEKNWQIALLSGVLLAIIPAFVQVSFLGFVDHHVAEVLLSLTIYLFILKALNESDLRIKIKYICISMFVLLLAIFTWPGTPIFIGTILIYLIIQNIIDKKYINLIIIIISLITFTGIIYSLFPITFQNLTAGINYLASEGSVMQQIQEAQPLFFTGQGIFTLEPSWYAFNISLYIGILGLLLIVKNYRKLDNGKIFFLTWTIIVLVLNLYQIRFIYLFAVNIAIMSSYIIAESIHSKKNYIKMLGIILLLSTFIFSIQMDNIMAKNPLMLSNDWFTSLEWLEQNTPDTNSSWASPSKDNLPNYGIMTWWSYGNYVLYLSKRPVISNNFQLGIDDSANFFASENETDANNILNKRRVKYVIVDYSLGMNVFRTRYKTYIKGSWVSIAIVTNKDMKYYLDINNFPNEKYLNTMYAKLYLFDGKGLDNYKLIYKSGTKYPDLFNRPIEEIKIFEYIE